MMKVRRARTTPPEDRDPRYWTYIETERGVLCGKCVVAQGYCKGRCGLGEVERRQLLEMKDEINMLRQLS